MAAKLYTAEELLELMRLQGMLNDTAADGSQDADLLQHLNQAMLTELVPILLDKHEEYFVITRRYTISGPRFRMPARAVGQRVRDVVYVDSAASSWRSRLTRINREDIWAYAPSAKTSGNWPTAFYLEGNTIVLLPDTATGLTGSLELSFAFRPGQLVLSTATRKVSAVNTTAGTITLDSAPPASWTAALRYDLHSPSSGAEIRAFDLAITDLTGSVMTATPGDIDGSAFGTQAVAVGDYVCLAGEAALPALPLEMHPILAQTALVRYLEAAGDTEVLGVHQAQLNRTLENSKAYTETRVEGRPQKLISRRSFF